MLVQIRSGGPGFEAAKATGSMVDLRAESSASAGRTRSGPSSSTIVRFDYALEPWDSLNFKSVLVQGRRTPLHPALHPLRPLPAQSRTRAHVTRCPALRSHLINSPRSLVAGRVRHGWLSSHCEQLSATRFQTSPYPTVRCSSWLISLIDPVLVASGERACGGAP